MYIFIINILFLLSSYISEDFQPTRVAVVYSKYWYGEGHRVIFRVKDSLIIRKEMTAYDFFLENSNNKTLTSTVRMNSIIGMNKDSILSLNSKLGINYYDSLKPNIQFSGKIILVYEIDKSFCKASKKVYNYYCEVDTLRTINSLNYEYVYVSKDSNMKLKQVILLSDGNTRDYFISYFHWGSIESAMSNPPTKD